MTSIMFTCNAPEQPSSVRREMTITTTLAYYELCERYCVPSPTPMRTSPPRQHNSPIPSPTVTYTIFVYATLNYRYGRVFCRVRVFKTIDRSLAYRDHLNFDLTRIYEPLVPQVLQGKKPCDYQRCTDEKVKFCARSYRCVNHISPCSRPEPSDSRLNELRPHARAIYQVRGIYLTASELRIRQG